MKKGKNLVKPAPAAPADVKLQKLLDSLEKAPQRIKKQLRAYGKKLLHTRLEEPSRPSVRELLATAAESEVIHGAVVRLIAGADRPAVPGYKLICPSENLPANSMKVAKWLKSLEGARKVNLACMERLPAAAWERVGLVADRGEVSLRACVEEFAIEDRKLEDAIAATIRMIGERKMAAKQGGKKTRKKKKKTFRSIRPKQAVPITEERPPADDSKSLTAVP